MANWQYKVDFSSFYHDYPDTLSIQDVAKRAVGKLNSLLKEIREEPEEISLKALLRDDILDLAEDLEYDIIPQFEEIMNDEDANEEYFDSAMNYLYDWADAQLEDKWNGAKMCWVNIF